MDARLAKLYLERGRLQERIRLQRLEVARAVLPLNRGLGYLNRIGDRVHALSVWMSEHRMVVTATVVTLVLWRPRIVWRLATTGYGLWRHWKRVRHWILPA